MIFYESIRDDTREKIRGTHQIFQEKTEDVG
jgi:hypothetical protein